MVNLIYRQGNYGSICFPYGRSENGGSCEFATKKCLEECSERCLEMKWFKEVLEFFETQDTLLIYKRIIKEMKDNDFKLLFWFDCGDCPKALTSKVLTIIKQLNEDEMIQLGYTRNKGLWSEVKKIKGIPFMLTVENESQIKVKGYYAIPDYKTERVQIINYKDVTVSVGGGYHVCGGGTVYNVEEVVKKVDVALCSNDRSNTSLMEIDVGKKGKITEANCWYCYKDKIGCFNAK